LGGREGEREGGRGRIVFIIICLGRRIGGRVFIVLEVLEELMG
jgi:hypothetical protein